MRAGGFILLALIVMIVWSFRLKKKEQSRASQDVDEQESEGMSVDDMVLMDELEGDDLND